MLRKFLCIICLLYSLSLLSQDIVYKPAEKCFEHLIVEKSNFDFKDDKEFNKKEPKYLRKFAPGTFLKEFGSWDKFPTNWKMFDSVSAKNTEDNWIKYKDKIIELSKSKNLDYISLTKCLDTIKEYNDDRALLPIAAYQCKNRTHNVWIIILRWENKSTMNKDYDNGYPNLMHIREYAIDVTNFEIIAYDTCG